MGWWMAQNSPHKKRIIRMSPAEAMLRTDNASADSAETNGVTGLEVLKTDSAEDGVTPALARLAFLPGPYRKGELVLRATTDAQLAELVRLAEKAGAKLLDVAAGLRAVRLVFPDSASMSAFLTSRPAGMERSVEDSQQVELNYTVQLPAPPPPVDPYAPGALTPFGDGVMSFLGVPTDNSNWGRGTMLAMLDTGLSPGETGLLRGSPISELDLMGGNAPDPGHGDLVAALLEGTANGQGIVPGASLLSVRVLDSAGVGDVFTVSSGLNEAVQRGAKVVSLSLGTTQSSDILATAVQQALSAGVLIVAAAGNDGVGQVAYPAAYSGVVAVSAVDANGIRATFSNYGPEVLISAPGVGIATQTPAGTKSFSGTSAAAPLVAGALSYIMSTDPTMTAQEAVKILTNYADYAGPVTDANRNDFYGAGVVDLARVMAANDVTHTDMAFTGVYANMAAAVTDGGVTMVPVQVGVQNRGSQAQVGAQINLLINGQVKSQLLPPMAPNQVRAVTINVPMQSLTGAGVIVNASMVSQFGDATPQNNQITQLLQVRKAAP